MAWWRVVSGDKRLIIETTADGRISLDVLPHGEPLTVDAITAQDIRVKIGAAIGVVRDRGDRR
jgi:hypothetical protein